MLVELRKLTPFTTNALGQTTQLDPIEPIKREAPSSTPYVLAGVSSAIGGVTTGLGVAGGINDAGFQWKNGGYERIP